jgi:Ethanolamine utilization protein EutJ (predicted chaperonin)
MLKAVEVPTTSARPQLGLDVDSSSQALLPETVDEAMQLMQGMIRNVGLNLSKVVDGPSRCQRDQPSRTPWTLRSLP